MKAATLIHFHIFIKFRIVLKIVKTLISSHGLDQLLLLNLKKFILRGE